MIDPQSPIAMIVLDHSECAAVFARHGIDFCCKGQRPLDEACQERDLSLAVVLDELELAIKRRTTDVRDVRSLTTRELITQVIGRHHRYLHRTLPFLDELATKVARVHGSREPTLREVAARVTELAATLRRHLKDEEEILFPALLCGAASAVTAELANMCSEHDEIGEMLSGLRAATSDFAVPGWACNRYRALMSELAQLEADTLEHVHLENHVLLPRFASPATETAEHSGRAGAGASCKPR